MPISLYFRDLLPSGTEMELEQLVVRLKEFLLKEHKEDGTHIIAAGTTLDQTHPYVTVGNVAALTKERALTGTANEIDITDNGAGTTVSVGIVPAVTIETSLSVPTLTVSGLTSGRIPIAGTGGLIGQDSDLTFLTDTLTATNISTTLATATTLNVGGVAGAATALRTITKKITGIADNVATDILTVTIPNANHAASIRLTFLSSNGGTDAFESSRCASGMVVVARTTGVNAVATAAALDSAAIATVAAGATHTLAYGLSVIAGAVGASNTFTIQATIDDSGNLGSNQLVVLAELINAEATGITIA